MWYNQTASHVIANISLKNFNASAGTKLLLYENSTSDGDTDTSFSLNPEGLNFTRMDITINATGQHLLKCTDFNYTTQTCFGD